MRILEFTSGRFEPYLPEEAQQNPGAYGFELADWLARRLIQAGFVTSYPVGEDWGWFIEYLDGDTEIMIGCGSEAREGDGYRGEPLRWRVFVRQRRQRKGLFSRAAEESPMLGKLSDAIEQALMEEGVSVHRHDER